MLLGSLNLDGIEHLGSTTVLNSIGKCSARIAKLIFCLQSSIAKPKTGLVLKDDVTKMNRIRPWDFYLVIAERSKTAANKK